ADPGRPLHHQAGTRAPCGQIRPEGSRYRRHLAYRLAIPAACRGARAWPRAAHALRGRFARRYALLVQLPRLLRRARQSRASRLRAWRAGSARGAGRDREPARDGLGARGLRPPRGLRRHGRRAAARRFASAVDARRPRRTPLSRCFRAAIPGMKLFLADGWIAAGYLFVWQIALFLSLGESFVAFGGALALAALVGAVSGLLLGRLIDAGHGQRAVTYAIGVLAFTTVLRALAPGHALLAVVANALGALVVCLYIPTIMTAVYNQAKRSPCTLRFHVATEGAWDVGAASGCLLAALLSA